jgi:hypothetical protein
VPRLRGWLPSSRTNASRTWKALVLRRVDVGRRHVSLLDAFERWLDDVERLLG